MVIHNWYTSNCSFLPYLHQNISRFSEFLGDWWTFYGDLVPSFHHLHLATWLAKAGSTRPNVPGSMLKGAILVANVLPSKLCKWKWFIKVPTEFHTNQAFTLGLRTLSTEQHKNCVQDSVHSLINASAPVFLCILKIILLPHPHVSTLEDFQDSAGESFSRCRFGPVNHDGNLNKICSINILPNRFLIRITRCG